MYRALSRLFRCAALTFGPKPFSNFWMHPIEIEAIGVIVPRLGNPQPRSGSPRQGFYAVGFSATTPRSPPEPGGEFKNPLPSFAAPTVICHPECNEGSRQFSPAMRGLVYPERNTEILRFAQDDSEWAQNDSE